MTSEIQKLNERFNQLSSELSINSLNYVANWHLYLALGCAGEPLVKTIETVLGNRIEVFDSYRVLIEEAVEEITNSLDYVGDESSHPNREFLATVLFCELKADILGALSGLLKTSDLIIGFSLSEGHPFYPVFWDFAYLIEKGSDVYILIGSSSD